MVRSNEPQRKAAAPTTNAGWSRWSRP